MNEALLDLINGMAGQSGALDSAIRFCASDAIYLLGLLGLVAGLVQLRAAPRRTFEIGVTFVIAAVVALVLLVLAANLVDEARPFIAHPDTVQLISHRADNSFPSDHSTAAGLMAGIALLAWRWWGVAFVALAVLIGLGRVAAGIHYPGDILGAWAIAAVGVAVAWVVAPLVIERAWRPHPPGPGLPSDG